MLVLGIILLLVAAVLVVGVLAGGGGQPTVDLGALHIATTTAAIFLAGVGTVLLVVLGLWLLLGGARRANQRRHDKKELTRLTRKLEAHEGAGAGQGTAAAEGGAAPDAEEAPTAPGTAEPPTAAGTAEAPTAPGTAHTVEEPVREQDPRKP